MRRVLLVSPHFPPSNAPDHQRVRMSLPFYEDFGWQPTVLAVDPKFVEVPRDELLLQTLPAHVAVHRVTALSARLTRKAGLGNLGLRALPWIVREGTRLLRAEKFDLVYFSTAMFAVATAGPIWRKRFGIPFVIDFQDPWLSTYYEERPHLPRPRKYWFAHSLDKFLEPRTLQKAAGVTAVSPAYCETLQARYANVASANCLTLPFGASAADFDVAGEIEFRNRFFDANDGLLHGLYVGVVAASMHSTIQLILEALAAGVAQEPELFANVRLHFIGTSYAPAHLAEKRVLQMAEKAGVSSLVTEMVERVPYLHALRLMKEAAFLLLPGSDDPQYTASKVYPSILARKPILAVFHRESSVVSVLRETNAADPVTFNSETSGEALRGEIEERWKHLLARLPFVPETNWEAFEPFTAREMTRNLCAFFDRMVEAQETAE